MSNIRIDLEATVINGQTLTFKSPVDCSQITGLILYYPEGNSTKSTVFQFADAHGNNVGSINLFAANVLVKVVLDTDLKRAYVQNADTNAYLENRFASLKASDVGARPDNWMPTAADVGARPNTWMPSASDVGARPNTWTPTAADVGALPKSGGTMSGAINMGSKKITNLATPTADTDATTKKYVDDTAYRRKGTYADDIDVTTLNGLYWLDKTKCTGTFPEGFGQFSYLDACNAYQRLIQYTNTGVGNIYERYYTNNKWYPWIQTDSSDKQDAITGLTSGMVMICNSSGAITTSSVVSTTELGYLDGVTSKIQTQLNGKVSKFVKLWTNGSPASAYNAKTVSLDLSGYSDIYIIYRVYASGAAYKSLFLDVGNAGIMDAISGDGAYRGATASTTGVTFGAAYDAKDVECDQHYCVPYQIYGINIK